MKVFLYILPAVVIAAVFQLAVGGGRSAPAEDSIPAAVPDDQADGKTPLQSFMREKLDASNRILEGLVTDDMRFVTDGADGLLKMSHAEQWRASADMLYLQHSRTYRESVKALQNKARKNSADGVALAWMDVTLNCIRCHEWVRNVIIADNPDLGSSQDSQGAVQ